MIAALVLTVVLTPTLAECVEQVSDFSVDTGVSLDACYDAYGGEPVSLPPPGDICAYAYPDMVSCKECAKRRADDECGDDSQCYNQYFTMEYGWCVDQHCPPWNYLCDPDGGQEP